MTIHPDDIDKWVHRICEAFSEIAESIEGSAPTDEALDEIGRQLRRIADAMEKKDA